MQANAITDSPNGQYDNDDVLAGAKLENPYTRHAADCSCRECAFEGAPAAVGADPDLKDPIRVRLKFDESLRPALVKFAHMKDMDIELLFDKLTEEVVERMRRRKMIPDTVRHLVE